MGKFDLSLLFFFQAEDGIRDKLVTGVQTCALPISSLCSLEFVAHWHRGRSSRCTDCSGARRVLSAAPGENCSPLASFPARERSEERRVGKECRSRWSPYH